MFCLLLLAADAQVLYAFVVNQTCLCVLLWLLYTGKDECQPNSAAGNDAASLLDCFALIAQLVHAVFVSVGLQHLP